MRIPTFEFHPKGSVDREIEIIELESLYHRLLDLEHNLTIPHRLEFHCLLYIEQGEGSHFIDFNRYPYQAGSFIFIGMHQVHAFDSEAFPQGKAIFFTQAFMDSSRINIRVPAFISSLIQAYTPVFIVNPLLKESAQALFLEIDKEISSGHSDELITQLLFSILLLKLSRERPSGYTNQISERQAMKFSKFVSLIDKHHTKTRNASAYAEMMGMTYKSLNQTCKLACKQTAKQLIDAHTILEAKRRLVVEKVQVQELAYQLGFEETSNFTKYFKKQTLTTPLQFKENYKG